MVIMDSSVPGRVSRCRPAWRKYMISTIRLVSTIVFIGLSETNTIGYYSMLGIQELLTVVERVKKINKEIIISGVLITFAEHTVLFREVMENAKKEFGARVFNTVIRKNVRLAEAPSAHQTIYEYDSESIGATDYLNFVREFISWRKPVRA